MIIEACRIVTDWLNDGTNGVNALLPSTPLDAGDSAPTAMAAIVDATRDGNAARGRLPAALPGIAIVPLPAENLAPLISIGDAEGDVKIAVRYGMTKPASEQGFRDTSYVLRTILRSIRRLNAAGQAALTRNGIYLEGAHEIRMVQLWEDLNDSVVTGALVITFHIRDNNGT